MDTLDKFFLNYSYKFPKGYPDMNDPNDKKLLFEIFTDLTKDYQIPIEPKIEENTIDESSSEENT